MTRGLYMQLKPVSRSQKSLVFQVLAAGWNGDNSEMVEVGTLTIDIFRQVATFSTTGPWQREIIAEPFTDRPLANIASDGIWTRWLLELGTKALAGSSTLVRFV